MLKNQLKIAWRNLAKNKLQTLINILGLTIGTVSCLVILSFIFDQLGYEQQFDDVASIYRIGTKVKSINNNSIDTNMATGSPAIPFALKADFPEVLEACRLVYFGEGNESLLRVSDRNEGYYEPRGYVADSTFFKLFNYPFIEGNSETALNSPSSVVLSSALAKKFFGNEKAIDKTLVLGAGASEISITVSGVFDEDFGKTHLNPNYVLSMNSPGLGAFVQSVENFATQNFTHSYLKIAPNTSVSNLTEKIPEFLQRRGGDDLAAAGFDKELYLQPITDIHLYSKGIDNQIDAVSNIEYLYAMLLLAFIIQIVACINFINLSTARANKRAKEIGVRKVVGANKSSLVRQFLGESLLLSLCATIIAVPISIVLLPITNELTQGDVALTDVINTSVLSIIFGVGIFTGLLAGVYPALVLSAIKPIRVLKGVVNLQSSNGNFRRALVVFQFVVATALITSVIVITQQLQFAQQKDMGFTKENLLAIRLGTSELSQNFEALKSEFLSVSGVLSITGSNQYPSETILGDLGLHLPGQNPASQTLVFYNGIHQDYFKTVGTSLLIGRDLRANDSTQIIVNKATIDVFNIPLEKAISSKLIQTYEGDRNEYEIVGVTNDYHFASLKEAIAPIMLFNETEPDWLIVKTEQTDFKKLLGDLESRWKATNPYAPFIYTFVDENVAKLYAEEQRLGKLSIVFTFLAILISCLGLFGLVSYVAEQKKKEIGIRKVLGASVKSVVQLLTKDFVTLVVFALLISAPIAYYFMQRWLESFTYKIEIQWWVFLLAGAFALTITILTVGVQSIKSAVANPVKSLRTE